MAAPLQSSPPPLLQSPPGQLCKTCRSYRLVADFHTPGGRQFASCHRYRESATKKRRAAAMAARPPRQSLPPPPPHLLLPPPSHYCKCCRTDKPIMDFYTQAGRLCRWCNTCRERSARSKSAPPLQSSSGRFCKTCWRNRPITDFGERAGRPYRTCNRCRQALAKKKTAAKAALPAPQPSLPPLLQSLPPLPLQSRPPGQHCKWCRNNKPVADFCTQDVQQFATCNHCREVLNRKRARTKAALPLRQVPPGHFCCHSCGNDKPSCGLLHTSWAAARSLQSL